VGIAALPNNNEPTPKPGKVIRDPLLVTGKVRIGSDLIGNAGSGLIGNAGSGLSPQDALIGNAGSGLTATAPLATVPYYTTVGPLTSVAPLTSALPLGNLAAAPYAILGRHILAGESGLYVEAVDADTGERVGYGTADNSGRFKIQVAAEDFARALIMQVTGLNKGFVSGFMSAALPVPANFDTVAQLDISPGSTAIVFSEALLAGVRGELKVDTGFRGFTSEEMAFLLRNLDATDLMRAQNKLDSTIDIGKPRDAASILAGAAETGYAIGEKTIEKALAAGGSEPTGAHLAAALRALIRGMHWVERDPAEEKRFDAKYIVDGSVSYVRKDAVGQDAEKLFERLVEAADPRLGDTPLRPNLTPTPIATPSATLTPKPSPTPGASPSPGSSATPSARPSPSPSPTPPPTPRPSSLFTVSISPSILRLNAMPPAGAPEPGFTTTGNFKATVLPAGQNKGVTWTSSHPEYVSVASGSVSTKAGAPRMTVVITAASVEDPNAIATASVEITFKSGLEVEVQ
jgi:hypothetical protein